MNRSAFICICTAEYLNHYIELYKSLQEHAPGEKQILYYIKAKKTIDEIKEEHGFDEIVDLTSEFYTCNPSYNILERICSLRARVVLDAFEKGYTNVVFLGAKVEFFSSPHHLISPLNAFIAPYKAVVTPHILEPLPDDGKFPSNASVSFTGHISTDVVAFRNDPEIIKFLQWQDEIMKTQCKTTNNTYLDQSWLNFLPFFVNNVYILRHPGYNVAYWCYKQRNMEKCMDGRWMVSNKDERDFLTCFQYSGLDLNNPENISTHQNRYKAEGDFLEFLKDYAKRVK